MSYTRIGASDDADGGDGNGPPAPQVFVAPAPSALRSKHGPRQQPHVGRSDGSPATGIGFAASPSSRNLGKKGGIRFAAGDDSDSDSDSSDDRRRKKKKKRTPEEEKMAKMLKAKLEEASKPQAMAVSRHPAPPCDPPRHVLQIPAELRPSGKAQSDIDRMINSTLGRSVTFCLTIVIFTGSALGLAQWSAPANRLVGRSWMVLVVTLAAIGVMYTALPKLALKSGMDPRDTGWKPYLTCYRCSYLTAVPALILLWCGGGATAFGEREGSAGGIAIHELVPSTWNYFEASDGFVALNLTLGIVETLSRQEHGDDGTVRRGRFRNARLQVNREPYSGVPVPTVPPDTLRIFRLAPVFTAWAPCVARYRISSACLSGHPVVAWAMSQTESVCSDLRMVACSPPRPMLEAVYTCTSGSPVRAMQYGPQAESESQSGLCGRVVRPPPGGVLDEMRVLLASEGWPEENLPNVTMPWIDVQPDECIDDPASCRARWTLFNVGGVFLSILTVCCIAVPACLDCHVDRRIREAEKLTGNGKL